LYRNDKHGRHDTSTDDYEEFEPPWSPDEEDDREMNDFDYPDAAEPVASVMAADTGKIRPPVKWHGGKFFQVPQITKEFAEHRIYGEPFGGGASVLLNKPPVDVEAYNDLDLRITRLFRVLRDDGNPLIRLLRLTPYSQIEFAGAADYPVDASDVEKARCDYVRWRQSFGGQGKSWSCTTTRARGGMAGDVNAWHTSIKQLPRVMRRLKQVQILCEPAVDFIRRFDHPEALFYCDPTYVHSTRTSKSVYGVEMTDQDHRELADVLNRCRAKVVISGYPSPLYQELYAEWKTVEFDAVKHSAGGKSKARAKECLWKNY